MAGRSHDVSAAFNAVAVTPSDAAVIPVTRGLWVGVAGNIAVRMAGANAGAGAVTFTGVPIGILPIQVDQVKSTSTTATTILALY